jgi:hypothetical protein
MTSTQILDMIDLLTAGRDGIIADLTDEGWIELRPAPERLLHPEEPQDFLRLVAEDNAAWRLHHLSHNGLLRGSAAFSGSMVGALYATVYGYFDTL